MRSCRRPVYRAGAPTSAAGPQPPCRSICCSGHGAPTPTGADPRTDAPRVTAVIVLVAYPAPAARGMRGLSVDLQILEVGLVFRLHVETEIRPDAPVENLMVDRQIDRLFLHRLPDF